MATRKQPRLQEVPKWFVTESELQGLSSYMRGRLTLDKVAMHEMTRRLHIFNVLVLLTMGPGAGRRSFPHTRVFHSLALSAS